MLVGNLGDYFLPHLV